jgi:arginine deiminase
LLEETVKNPLARKWILDLQVVPDEVPLSLIDETRDFLDNISARELAQTLLGGLSTLELLHASGGKYDKEECRLLHAAIAQSQYLLPPLPNALYTRDTTCWINGGVTLNPSTGQPVMKRRCLQLPFTGSILISLARLTYGTAINGPPRYGYP